MLLKRLYSGFRPIVVQHIADEFVCEYSFELAMMDWLSR